LGGAAVLLACTGVSYKTFKEQNGAACKPATAVGLGVSAAVTAGMLTRCGALGRHDKVAIAGVVASTAFTGEGWGGLLWCVVLLWGCGGGVRRVLTAAGAG
jgi:hypothetical protein